MSISISISNVSSSSKLDELSKPDEQSKPATVEMASVFGVSGPGNVEVLEYPTRRPQTRTSLTSENNYGEGMDAFASTPVGNQSAAFQSRNANKNSASEMGRWSSSSGRMLGSEVKTSHRFSQPLVSEGEGSVFPTDLPLDKRRAFEVELIRKFDRLEINTHVGDFWFVIDAIWMNSWVDFVMGKTGPPGCITNYNLYNREKVLSPARRESLLVRHASDARSRSGALAARPDLKLKEGLSKVRDYRAVHSLVWYLFREIYATDDAPDVCRWKADLYSDEVTATRKLRVEHKSHPTAVYELRRFVAKIKRDLEMEKDAAVKGTTP